ncbi:MAG TPA: TonB-dependent receptor, partial [Gemmatimonadaceae bacterium]|nr:TonB-dependent receptor [Gemmatimonadaceae bacterium]
FDPALNAVVGGGQSRRDGLDVSVNAKLTPAVTASTDFTVLHGFYTNFVNPDDNVDYTGTPIFNTSKYVGSASLDVAPPHGRWFAQIGVNAQGAYTPFEEPGILRPAYALVSAVAGVKLQSTLDFSVSVRNLLDTTYRELESGGQATPGQTRTMYVALRYRAR